MKLYPAIDLRGGQAVRLYQGDYDQMTVYNADPAAQAREFIAAGAKYLHVVDLDGAKDDTTANMTTIAAIAKQGGLFIEVGGGIRDEARIEQYLSLSVGRCILGTIAVKDFDFTARMAQKYGPKIAVGVDMRDGLVAVNGWKEVTPEPGVAFCRRCAEAGVQAIIATDISRDGTMQGTNMDLYRELLQIPGLEITASGGIARMEELAELQAMGCHAAILGKSIYTGAIKNPAIISAAAQRYGNQCVVLSADIKRVDGKFKLFTKGGRENTGIDALDWLEQGVKNGAGELVVNSIDTDGVKNGFDLELLDAVAQRCAVPIIASGGAGKMEDFKELFLNHPRVDAGLAASIFHTKQVDIRDLKLYLRENGVEMRV